MFSINSYCVELDETEATLDRQEPHYQGPRSPQPIVRQRVNVWEQVTNTFSKNPRSVEQSSELTVFQTKLFTLPIGDKQLMTEFAGQLFNLEIEGGSVILTHPRWSLVGLGSTLGDAERDLVEQARDALEALSFFQISEFSPDELEYRDFLLSVI